MDICIETKLYSDEKKNKVICNQKSHKTSEDIGLVYFRERDQSKFIGKVKKSNYIGKGIMVTLDGSMYESEYKAGEYDKGNFIAKYQIPRIDEAFFNNKTTINVDRKLNERKKLPGYSKSERYWDMSIELEYFKNSQLHEEEKVNKLLKDLLKNWDLDHYFEIIHKSLSLEDLLLSSKLLSVNGIGQTLGITKVGHRIKLANCIKQFRLVFSPLFLPKYVRHPTEFERITGKFLPPLFISKPINLYSYSGINIPFEQLNFLRKLERTDFPCKCSKGGKFFLLIKKVNS